SETPNMENLALMLKLGGRIKMIRKKKNLTQIRLASGCGVQKSSISKIEAGLANPTVFTLYKISNMLKVHMVELFKG
ncbi:MAG: helix-turn-helix transcriptional regulator, partial [Ferruginibacter sp.]